MTGPILYTIEENLDKRDSLRWQQTLFRLAMTVRCSFIALSVKSSTQHRAAELEPMQTAAAELSELNC